MYLFPFALLVRGQFCSGRAPASYFISTLGTALWGCAKIIAALLTEAAGSARTSQRYPSNNPNRKRSHRKNQRDQQQPAQWQGKPAAAPQDAAHRLSLIDNRSEGV